MLRKIKLKEVFRKSRDVHVMRFTPFCVQITLKVVILKDGKTLLKMFWVITRAEFLAFIDLKIIMI